MTQQWIDLAALPDLAALFRPMIVGRHISRLHDSAQWAGLEANEDRYAELFKALGFELKIDTRGFAWLQNAREDQAVHAKVRGVAFLLLLVFDRQAARGRSLEDFERWVIDKAMLREILLEHKDLLETESITNVGDLEKILKSAVRYGFARIDDEGWRMLAAARRFTDQFEALAEASELSGHAPEGGSE